MITFECGDCKTQLQRDESQAGRITTCSKCLFVLPIPGTSTDNLALGDSTKPAVERNEKKSLASKWSLNRAVFLAIIGGIGAIVLGIFVILTIGAIQKVREAAARVQSINNLKDIAMGFHAFNNTYRQLPFNGGGTNVGAPHTAIAMGGAPNSGSWGFQILPFVNQNSMFQNPDRTKPVPTYLCPGRGRRPADFSKCGGAWTDYFINNYLNDPDEASDPASRNRRHHLKQIQEADGTTHTVMVGHGNISISEYDLNCGVTFSGTVFLGGTVNTMRSGNNGLANPSGISLSRDSYRLPGIGSWGGPFTTGALMAMCDASVRNFPYSVSNFGAFLTPSGQENTFVRE